MERIDGIRLLAGLSSWIGRFVCNHTLDFGIRPPNILASWSSTSLLADLTEPSFARCQ
jgi:hypothetical protein